MTPRPDPRTLDTAVKPALKVGSSVCQCALCNLFFTGVAPFDRHLLGFTDKCRTPKQMRAIGMVTNKHGVWMYGKDLQDMKGSK